MIGEAGIQCGRIFAQEKSGSEVSHRNGRVEGVPNPCRRHLLPSSPGKGIVHKLRQGLRGTELMVL